MNKVSLTQSHNQVLSSIFSKQDESTLNSTFAFIPYNKKWGVSQILGSVPAKISSEQKCVIVFEEATSYLTAAICKCVGKEANKKKKAKYVTFDVKYSEKNNCYIIEKDSFQMYYGNINQLGALHDCGVFLEIDTYISPDGQVWASEDKYEEYASTITAIYEGSDGTLTQNYTDFKTWEQELVLRPNNPNGNVLPYTISLKDIEHYEVASDGTIWKDVTLLQEYLAWRNDHNHNYEDGYYCGIYGVANSFKEYVHLYNTCYFTVNRLRRDEQYMDSTYRLLFSSQDLADNYINRLKSFQKKI